MMREAMAGRAAAFGVFVPLGAAAVRGVSLG